MNNTQAKRIRKEVYGDMALEKIQERKYQPQIRFEGGKPYNTGAIFCTGLRKLYLKAKKEYKDNKRNNKRGNYGMV